MDINKCTCGGRAELKRECMKNSVSMKIECLSCGRSGRTATLTASGQIPEAMLDRFAEQLTADWNAGR